jgi:multidrug efflux pump subunit AcrB
VERLLIDPIEEAMNELDDVKKIVSVANDGLGLVLIDYNYVSDPEKKQDEAIREFNRLRPQLPADLNYIDIRRAGPARVNILQAALVSESAPWRELEKWAGELEDRLERVPGIRQSESWAYPKSEIRIAVDLDRLGRTAVTLQQLATAVQAENTSIPGGAVDAGARRYDLKTTGSFRSLQEIENTVVGASRGRIVRLADVATVSWATGEHTYLGRYKGQRAVFITASQKDNQNIFKVRAGVDAVFDAYEKDLPQGIRLERGFDQSRNVDRRLTRLGQDFAIAIALVLVTLLPLGLRAAGVVMLSIPLSLAMGLSALYFSGFSLNQLSIAGFILALAVFESAIAKMRVFRVPEFLGAALLLAQQPLVLRHHRHAPVPGEGHHLADADAAGHPPGEGVLQAAGAHEGHVHQLGRAALPVHLAAEGG